MNRPMKHILAWVAVAAMMLLGVGATPAKDILDYVPADSEVVATISFADLTARPVIRELWRTELVDGPAGAGARLFERLTGVDITRDIETIVLAGQVDRDEAGVALIKGTYDEQKLLDLARLNPTYQLLDIDGVALHRWKDKKNEKFATFLPEGILLIGNTAARIKDALGAGDSADGSFRANHAAEIPAGVDAWIWLARPNRPGTKLGDGMELIGVAGTTTRVLFAPSDVVIETVFQPDRPGDVTDHVALLEGVTGIGRLQQRKPGLTELANRTNTEVRDGRAVLTTRISNDDFTRMIREAIDRKR